MLKNIYLNPRLFQLLGILIILCLFSYNYPILFGIVKLLFFALIVAFFIDVFLLFRLKKGITAERIIPDKLSNGDENPLSIPVSNHYPFSIYAEIIDELPFQFQLRDLVFKTNLKSGESRTIAYTLRPTERGEYNFGALNIYVNSPLCLAKKRYQFSVNKLVPVYPSFMQMRKYEILAISNRLQEYGIKKIRRIGQSMEFEQIRNYVVGDDYRNVNWKASARKGEIMVNQFQDEKSQQVFCIVDKGRVMKMPFEGLSLLDYAINATLVMTNIALKKGDKAGFISFSHIIGSMLPARKQRSHIRKIQELLYKESTDFLESDYEKLYLNIRRKITQRSLLLLFTNFTSVSALHRQLPFLRRMAKQHLLVVIFFENTELNFLLNKKSNGTEDIYQKIIAEKFIFEQKLIVKELRKHGIQSILTTPENLTVNTINKYLELKARGLI